VGLHELLGHGSGKLFRIDENGKYNFDKDNTVTPQDKLPIKSWYKPGETYDSVFGAIGSSLEECRAEAVGIFLCRNREILSLFGYSQTTDAATIKYVNWLNMVRSGLLGLEFYTPHTQKWGQAHMQARFAILQVLLEAGKGLVSITRPAENDILLNLDASLIDTVGIPAVARFLETIQVLKSTAAASDASSFYGRYTSVSAEFLRLRQIVMEKKKPRQILVQANTRRNSSGGDASSPVLLLEYDSSCEGIVKSFVERFPGPHDVLPE